MKLLRFVVCGAGSIGREFALKHLVLENNVEVVAVIDVNIECALSLARDVAMQRAGAVVIGSKYRETVDQTSIQHIESANIPNVTASTQLDDAILSSVDCVYIGVPPSSHRDLVVTSLSAKKHVLLEKPISVSDEDSDMICELAEQAFLEDQVVVNVNIGMRFCDAARHVFHQLHHNSLGDVTSMKLKLGFITWPRSWQTQPWVGGRKEGGPLVEVGTHWIFAILEILGHESPPSIDKSVNRYVPSHYDVSDVVVEYCDGLHGSQCESKCYGNLILEYTDVETRSKVKRVSVEVDIKSQCDEARILGKDVYELHIFGPEQQLVLYDFTKLRDAETGRDLVVGSYGRKECVDELKRAIESHGRFGDLVTPREARTVQRIISAMKRRCKYV